MNLDTFKDHVTIVQKQEAEKIRTEYIRRFINTDKEHYKKYIANLQEFSDGVCYIGYIWDCIKEPCIIDFQIFTQSLLRFDKVLVFWDVHSSERILIENYWKFGKESILRINSNILIENLIYLPQDIYIFDESFKWTLILTHEYVNNKRFCFKFGEIP